MKQVLDEEKARVKSLFSEFLTKEYLDIIKRRLQSSTSEIHDDKNIFSLPVSFASLCEFSTSLSQQLLSSPLDILTLFNEALKDVISDLDLELKNCLKFVVRVVSLPAVSEVFRSTIPRSDYINKFFALQCTVTRVGSIQVAQMQKTYVCSKCGHRILVEADFSQFYQIPLPPRSCPNTDEGCTSNTFKTVTDDPSSELHSFQEIRVNERIHCLAVGKMPKSIICVLEDDLVDSVRPGDDVIVNGIITHRWGALTIGAPFEIETVFRANSVENLSEMRFRGEIGGVNFTLEMGKRYRNYWEEVIRHGDFKGALRLRDEIVRSICPDVYGLYFVKLSLALVLVGAPQYANEPEGGADTMSLEELLPHTVKSNATSDDFRVRSNIHLLLVGEPSTAKSALLRAGCRLSPRAVFTSATGATAAGLTAAAVRDGAGGGWALEAGALVLADGEGGVCAIDEFAGLRGPDRAAVHEAMEQQTVSMAKAGLVARLNCRCSVIAASSVGEDVAEVGMGEILPTPLLSRFDLIWRMSDPVGCEAWDSAVASHVLGLVDRSTEHTKGKIVWTTEELRNYISWVRLEFQPRLCSGAAQLLQRYYALRRRTLELLHGADDDQAVSGRTTLRLLESLVRITQAHARLMARETTTVEDAVVAIWLMESSIQSTFGRCASALEVGDHCVTSEETVTRHGMEDSFEDIFDAVMRQLNMRPDEIDPQWRFGSSEQSVFNFKPIFMSTQVAGSHLPKFEETENTFGFDIGSFMPSGLENRGNEDSTTRRGNLDEEETHNHPSYTPSERTQNPFDFDVDSYMPGDIGDLGKEAPSMKGVDSREHSSPPSTSVSQRQSQRKERALPPPSSQNTNWLERLEGEEIEKPLAGPSQCSSRLNSTKRPSSNGVGSGLGSRVKNKLSRFAFVESAETSSYSVDENRCSPPKRPAKSEKNCLDLQNLAPEDWNFSNLDFDFDL